MMSIDRSNQGTLEEQMFYKRRTLQDLTKMRHENRQDQVIHWSFNKGYHQFLRKRVKTCIDNLFNISNNGTILNLYMSLNPPPLPQC